MNTNHPAIENVHHPDCPARYYLSRPDRCRCVFMAALAAQPQAETAQDDGDSLLALNYFRAQGLVTRIKALIEHYGDGDHGHVPIVRLRGALNDSAESSADRG